MTQTLHAIAPTREGQAVTAAFGQFKNHMTEWSLRASNLYRIGDPAARRSEEQFLDAWLSELTAERHRIIAWRYDLHRRQIARGQLIPQEDGSFIVGDLTRPGTAVGAVGKAVTTAPLKGFARTQFRTKFGIAGLILSLIGVAAVMGGAGQLGALFGVFGVLFLIAWFFMGALGLGGGSRGVRIGAGGVETNAAAMQLEAIRAQAERDARAEEEDARERAEAERRRQEAIERAAQMAGNNDVDEW